MMNFFKPKRHDPEAVARAVLRSASDPEIFGAFWKEFGTIEDQHPRVLFSVIIFAYCWARGWSIGKKDARVSEAYARAAGIIALRFKDAAKLVRVSDYVVSELEISQLYCDLSEHFNLRIPTAFDPTSDVEIISKAVSDAVCSYQLPFEILIRAIMRMRSEQMDSDISDGIAGNLDIPGVLKCLSGTLNGQITGVTALYLARNPDLIAEELWISQPRRLLVIQPLIKRLAAELESL